MGCALVCPCMRGTEDEGSATTSYFKNVSGKLEAF